MTEQSDYLKYRGKCREFSEEACRGDPMLKLKRGYYYCPFWGKQAHWWTVRQDGTIFDPTKDQFPSKGSGIYEEFDGTIECEECGKIMNEKDAKIYGRYAFCSSDCITRTVLG